MTAPSAGEDIPGRPRAATAERRPRVIAVNRFYWPDESATSQLLTDLATHLADHAAAEVTVIASRLRYDDPEARLAAREARAGVRIRRVRTTRLGREWLPGRLLDYLTFHVAGLAALISEARQGDVILVTTDPPLFVVTARLAAWLRGARLVAWSHDLFPEIAAALGLRRADGRLGAWLRWLRNRALGAADAVVAISPAIAARLARALDTEARITTIGNWASAGIYSVPGAANGLRADWGLEGRFVIGYCGNLGRAHSPERIAELVRRTQDIPGLAWLFVGGGVGLRQVRAAVAQTGARNVVFRAYQPRDDLARVLSVPDLHLVSLDPACEGLSYPSKLHGIAAAGRPTLFLGDPAGEVAQALAAAETGVTLDPARPETWRATVAGLMRAPERCAAMGERAGARYDASHESPELAAWSRLIETVAEAPVATSRAPETRTRPVSTATPGPPAELRAK